MSKKRGFKNLKLRRIQPKTKAQERVFQAYDDELNLVLTGCAGTGKTFLGLYLAIESMLDSNQDPRNLIIFRSAVPTRDVGFLKGDLDQKMEVYETPYKSMVNNLFNSGTAYESLKHHRQIDFMSTSYNRGITIDNSVVLVDEAQNLTDHEINTIITRLGRNSRIIFCGDTHQTDLNTHRETTGFGTLIAIAERMRDDFEVVRFKPDDIVRSELVKRYIKARVGMGL